MKIIAEQVTMTKNNMKLRDTHEKDCYQNLQQWKMQQVASVDDPRCGNDWSLHIDWCCYLPERRAMLCTPPTASDTPSSHSPFSSCNSAKHNHKITFITYSIKSINNKLQTITDHVRNVRKVMFSVMSVHLFTREGGRSPYLMVRWDRRVPSPPQP